MKNRPQLIWCLVVAVVVSPFGTAVQAGEPGGTSAAWPIKDVALGARNTLRGTVVDGNGQPRTTARVELTTAGRPSVTVQTGPRGQFAVSDLRPGLYQVRAGESAHLLRLWTARTAPPAAQPAALLVEDIGLMRGQQWNPWQRALILSGVIVTSGVIGGVIGYNMKDDAS